MPDFLLLLRRYIVYVPLLIGLCIGIFPFVIFYCTTLGIGQILDAVAPAKQYGKKLDNMWTMLGKPYDYLVGRLL